jgi:hypothetical protein
VDVLFQEGHFPSSVMIDMVEADHRLLAMYNDPRLAPYRDEIRRSGPKYVKKIGPIGWYPKHSTPG